MAVFEWIPSRERIPPPGDRHCTQEEIMEATITSGKHLCEHADIGGSRFRDVGMANTEFDDVALLGARFHNVNLAGARFDDVNLTDVEITNSSLAGTKINGVLVTELFRAYEQARR
jgi:uncharacterized protein YjbI with pentapeptide repeats